MKKKLILCVLFLFTLINICKSQDYIYLKEGGKFEVKIVKADKNNLYFYLKTDSTKSIKKVSTSIISQFDYNSKNNTTFQSEDSLLLKNYFSQIETNILNTKNESEENSKMVDEYMNNKYMENNKAVYHFSKAKTHFGLSLLFVAAGSVITTIALTNTIPTNPLDPKYNEQMKEYTKKLQTSQYLQLGTLAISTAFTISSISNLFDGLVELAKKQK